MPRSSSTPAKSKSLSNAKKGDANTSEPSPKSAITIKKAQAAKNKKTSASEAKAFREIATKLEMGSIELSNEPEHNVVNQLDDDDASNNHVENGVKENGKHESKRPSRKITANSSSSSSTIIPKDSKVPEKTKVKRESTSKESKKSIVKKEPVVIKKEETDEEKKERLSLDRSKRRKNKQRKAAEGKLGIEIPWNATLEDQMKLLSRYGFLQGEKRLITEQLNSQKDQGRFAIPKARFSALLKDVIQETPILADQGFKFKRKAIEALHEALETEMVTIFNLANAFALASASTEPIVRGDDGKPLKNDDGITQRIQKFPPPGSTVTLKKAVLQAAAAVRFGKLGEWGSRSFQSAQNFIPPRFSDSEKGENVDDDYMEVDGEEDGDDEELLEDEEEEKVDKKSSTKSKPVKKEATRIKLEQVKTEKNNEPTVIDDVALLNEDSLHEHQIMQELME